MPTCCRCHALAGQQSHLSVLDKVVPGYYHRRMENGDICMSTCCNNTASEHAMCERLIVDDITHWARNYKVGGAITEAVLLQLSFGAGRPGQSCCRSVEFDQRPQAQGAAVRSL